MRENPKSRRKTNGKPMGNSTFFIGTSSNWMMDFPASHVKLLEGIYRDYIYILYWYIMYYELPWSIVSIHHYICRYMDNIYEMFLNMLTWIIPFVCVEHIVHWITHRIVGSFFQYFWSVDPSFPRNISVTCLFAASNHHLGVSINGYP